jgi:hypothetical protein
MAEQAVISAVIDEIVAAFDGNVNQFRAFLNRASLQAELDAIQSQIRNAQEAQSQDIDQYNEQIEGLQAALNAKQAEIDSL